jgi:hypothetical protein
MSLGKGLGCMNSTAMFQDGVVVVLFCHLGHVLSLGSLSRNTLDAFYLCSYITIPEGKLASGAPPKGSPEDGPKTPDGAYNQHNYIPRHFSVDSLYTLSVLLALRRVLQ